MRQINAVCYTQRVSRGSGKKAIYCSGSIQGGTSAAGMIVIVRVFTLEIRSWPRPTRTLLRCLFSDRSGHHRHPKNESVIYQKADT